MGGARVSDKAYVLHQRAYSENSQILQLFTANHGVISALAKGARALKSPFKGQLQPFIETQVTWSGRSDLKTLINAEQTGVVPQLAYLKQISMLYVSELITLVHMDDEVGRKVYALYVQIIIALIQADKVSLHLRRFEWQLAANLGYELQVPDSAVDVMLAFDPSRGLTQVKRGCPVRVLNQLKHGHTGWNDADMKSLQKLMQSVVNHLVQGKTIKTRAFLRNPLTKTKP